MNDRIYIKELSGYQTLTDMQKKRIKEDNFFDLTNIQQETLKQELRQYLEHRIDQVAITTLAKETYIWNQVCQFLQEKEPQLDHLLAVSKDVLEKRLQAWLLQHGYALRKRHYRKDRGCYTEQEADAILYLRRIRTFLSKKALLPERKKDIWDIRKLPVMPKVNPIRPHYRLDFTGIAQKDMRGEVKQIFAFHSTYKPMETLRMELWAIKSLSSFLGRNHTEITSFKQVTRLHMEAYLIYVRTESGLAASSYGPQLIHLKEVLSDLGETLACDSLMHLFLKQDFGSKASRLYQTYSKEELDRLNQYILLLDNQLARALLLHQMLGLRISDTLTLKRDCLIENDGQYSVGIHQYKSYYFEKPITKEIAQMIQAAQQYTETRHGKTEYIFVRESDPSCPMSYSRIEYQLKALIREQDIRGDDGQLLQFGTHIFRHNYGKSLAQLGADDQSIALLLGHRSLNSVKHYRALENKVLAEETRELRNELDELITNLMGGWDNVEI